MKKYLIFPLILLLIFNFCSCDRFCACDDSLVYPKENLNVPNTNSLIVYELSNGDTLTMLYSENEMFYGEWKHDDEVKRVGAWYTDLFDPCLLHSSHGYYGFVLHLQEIERLSSSSSYKYASENYNDDTVFATFDAGILNSGKITLATSGEALAIVSLKVEDSPFAIWNWNDASWADFDTYGEKTQFIATDMGLSYHPWRNIGELKIDETVLPIKLDFHEETMTISVYDISNNGSIFIIDLIGHMDAENTNIFIIDEISCTGDFSYAEKFTDIKDIKLTKTEINNQ